MSRDLFGYSDELRCPRELALKLGAIEPRDVRHYRELDNGATMLIRDPVSLRPMFWPRASERMALKSSR